MIDTISKRRIIVNKDIIFRKIKSWKFIILLFLCAVFYIFCKIDEALPTGKMSGTEEPDIGMHEIAPGRSSRRALRGQRIRLRASA